MANGNEINTDFQEEEVTIYKMDLHDEIILPDDYAAKTRVRILRVPNGWIYYRNDIEFETDKDNYVDEDSIEEYNNPGTFVPFNKEFLKKDEPKKKSSEPGETVQDG